jgi:uncharacterized membrane protein
MRIIVFNCHFCTDYGADADLKRFNQLIMIQTVRNKAMPLGNQTQMTDEERAQLGRWLGAH